ncbi:hypothetical protein [Lachnoclostridium sp. An131]|uniref:hypothetical protein n=1 Tax=Lachnoclostridium sp. An131 TaxID=1965555 RepID=UPI00117AA164|nr:hypothetical protein [Lachnoclostridium sp. An131]
MRFIKKKLQKTGKTIGNGGPFLRFAAVILLSGFLAASCFLLSPGPRVCASGWFDASFTVERLDEGAKLYVVMPEGGGLTPVNAGDVYYLSEYGSRIYFYIGLQPGYQNLEVWGDGIVTVPELTQDTDAPGAGEAYEAGCSLWMSFTHQPASSVRHRMIYVSCEPAATLSSYTVGYYLETEPGVYPPEPVHRLDISGVEEGTQVSAELAPEGLPLEGYVLDDGFPESLLSGNVAADGSLFLRVFYAVDGDGNGTADKYETPGGGEETPPEGGEETPGGGEETPGGGEETPPEGGEETPPEGGEETPGGGEETPPEGGEETPPEGGEETPGGGEETPGGGEETPGGGEETPGGGEETPGGGEESTGSGQPSAAEEPVAEEPVAEEPAAEEEETEEEMLLAETDDSADDTDGGTGESDGDSASAVGGYSMAQVSEYRIIPGRPEQETDGREYDEEAENTVIEEEQVPLNNCKIEKPVCIAHWLILLGAAAAAFGFQTAARKCRRRIERLRQELEEQKTV